MFFILILNLKILCWSNFKTYQLPNNAIISSFDKVNAPTPANFLYASNNKYNKEAGLLLTILRTPLDILQ